MSATESLFPIWTKLRGPSPCSAPMTSAARAPPSRRTRQPSRAATASSRATSRAWAMTRVPTRADLALVAVATAPATPLPFWATTCPSCWAWRSSAASHRSKEMCKTTGKSGLAGGSDSSEERNPWVNTEHRWRSLYEIVLCPFFFRFSILFPTTTHRSWVVPTYRAMRRPR